MNNMKMNKMMKAEDDTEECDEYEVDEAVRTLIKAEEIKQDKKLMAACVAQLDKKKKAINSIDGLRAKAKELDKADAED